MKVADLGITQEYLRDIDQLAEMIEYVRGGGRFTLEAVAEYCRLHNHRHPDLIEIARFEDGRMFLRNGHHRAVAIYLAGRISLCDDEYHVTDWKYRDFQDIHFLKDDGTWLGWVTPFDVRTHVRVADLTEFKKRVRYLFSAYGPESATDFINKNRELYCERKRFEAVSELASSVEGKVCA